MNTQEALVVRSDLEVSRCCTEDLTAREPGPRARHADDHCARQVCIALRAAGGDEHAAAGPVVEPPDKRSQP